MSAWSAVDKLRLQVLTPGHRDLVYRSTGPPVVGGVRRRATATAERRGPAGAGTRCSPSRTPSALLLTRDASAYWAVPGSRASGVAYVTVSVGTPGLGGRRSTDMRPMVGDANIAARSG